MKLKSNGINVNLPDGVDPTKFVAPSAVASIPKDVLKLFQDYGIDLKEECPGAFIKGFTLNEKELVEVSENLKVYAEKGLIDIIKANIKNLQVRVFKSSFVKRLLSLIEEGKPYLNPDNSFADFLLNNKENGLSNVTNEKAYEVNNFSDEKAYEINNFSDEKVGQMNAEEKQVYNEIVEKLNYLVLANPLDTTLASTVKNAIYRVKDAILRDEYKFLSLQEMVSSVMFDEIKLNDIDRTRIRDLVLGAFPDEERKMR